MSTLNFEYHDSSLKNINEMFYPYTTLPNDLHFQYKKIIMFVIKCTHASYVFLSYCFHLYFTHWNKNLMWVLVHFFLCFTLWFVWDNRRGKDRKLHNVLLYLSYFLHLFLSFLNQHFISFSLCFRLSPILSCIELDYKLQWWSNMEISQKGSKRSSPRFFYRAALRFVQPITLLYTRSIQHGITQTCTCHIINVTSKGFA